MAPKIKKKKVTKTPYDDLSSGLTLSRVQALKELSFDHAEWAAMTSELVHRISLCNDAQTAIQLLGPTFRYPDGTRRHKRPDYDFENVVKQHLKEAILDKYAQGFVTMLKSLGHDELSSHAVQAVTGLAANLHPIVHRTVHDGSYELRKNGVSLPVPTIFEMVGDSAFSVLHGSFMLQHDFVTIIDKMLAFVWEKDTDITRFHAFAMKVKAFVTLNLFPGWFDLAGALEAAAREKFISAAEQGLLDEKPIGYPWAAGWEDL